MNKKLIISGIVIAGVGVAGYFILRRPKLKLISVDIAEGKKATYKFQLGRKIVDYVVEQNVENQEVISFPLFSFVFATTDCQTDGGNEPPCKTGGLPSVEVRVTKRIGGDKPEIIWIDEKYLDGAKVNLNK